MSEQASPTPSHSHWQPGLGALGEAFVTFLNPVPLTRPHWIAHSPAAADYLGLDEAWLAQEDALKLFSGNALPEGARPWASVYSGHQFGVWAGQLGDGRALTLGTLPAADGTLQEIQLKGSGLTPYSRMGDGRAVLRSSIREFIASEAMQALGIPTTRALCLTGSRDPVYREQVETAAVVTRFAPSFIRFGHFEHFASRQQDIPLSTLADYVIGQHYPHCRQAPNPYAALLRAVAEGTADLIAQWQAIGFCHGVMNTDNMSMLALTIDYGPYQFLDAYDPGHICNHSDERGRYAYDRQPDVAYWNLYALGQALLPLIGEVDDAKAAVDVYPTRLAESQAACWAAKLGLQDSTAASELMQPLLMQLSVNQADFTLFWRRLSLAVAEGRSSFDGVRDLLMRRDALDSWFTDYLRALDEHGLPDTGAAMLRANPAVVPRNYLCQNAIAAAEKGDFSEVRNLLEACTTPYDTRWDTHAYAGLPPDWASGICVSCSS